MREGDGNSQPGEQPENTFMWVESARPTLLGHLLARQLAINNSIDPADGIEPVENLGSAVPFPGEIVEERKEKAIEQAKKYQVGTLFWTDGSKLDTGNVGAAITWRDKNRDEWKEMSVFLGKNKEILDADLWAIAMTLEAAKRETRGNFGAPITVFTDSREALTTIQQVSPRISSPFLRDLIYQRALDLKNGGSLVIIR